MAYNPKLKSIVLPRELTEEINDLAKNLDRPVEDLLRERVLSETPTVVADEQPLSDAIVEQYVLARLDRGHVDVLKELCFDTGRTPMDYIINYCRMAYDRGETALLLHSQERLGGDEYVPEAILAKTESICQYPQCGKSFTPKRIGQKFCGDLCGQANQQMIVRSKGRQNRSLDPDAAAFAPPTHGYRLDPEGNISITQAVEHVAAAQQNEALSAMQAQIKALTELVSTKLTGTAPNG